MYNPFDEVVMAQVMKNLGRSVAAVPRNIWLIYNTPSHHDLIVKARVFRNHFDRNISGTEFRVYTNA